MKTYSGPGLELIDVPVPSLGPTEVLIKIRSTGVCSTDVYVGHWDDWTARTVTTLLVLGHEFYGTVVKLGSVVTNLEVGQFVSDKEHYVYRRCHACLAGKRHLYQRIQGIGYHIDETFCGYFAMPTANIWMHSPELDPGAAAILDSFGNAVHAALRFPTLVEDVLVIDAGSIGIVAVPAVKFQGARNVVITDLNDEQLALMETLGITSTVGTGQEDPEEVYDRLSMRERFDIGLEMSGSGAALHSMVDHATHGDRITLPSTPSQELTVDFSRIVFSMLAIQGVTGRQVFETWYAMSALIHSGLNISGVIVHHFPMAELAEAFAVVGDSRSGKVVMHWEQ